MTQTAKTKETNANINGATAKKNAVAPAVSTVEMPEMPLTDNEIIVCTAQIPNMTYKDHKTGDMYTWQAVGDAEEISFSVLRDMYRNYDSYIKNLWITFDDERVVKKFRLERLYGNYKLLMSDKFYVKSNMQKIKEIIKEMPRGILETAILKVKSFITDGKISDLKVIRELERQFHVDLINLV